MIRPVDLQAIYMNLDKVGKEHALSRDHVLNQQALEAQKLLKLHDLERNAVNRTDASEETGGEGTKVKTDEHESEGGAGGHPRKRSDAKKEEETPPKDERWTDPKLGRHVDLSG